MPHDGAREVPRLADEPGDADERPVRPDVEEPAGGHQVRALDALRDLLERDVVRAELGRADVGLELRRRAPGADDLRHAGYGEEPELHLLVDDGADLGGRRLPGLAAHSDVQDLAHDARDGRHVGDHVLRQVRARQLELLLDDLPVAVDVGPPLELDVDHGQAHAGARAHAEDARGAVHGLLDVVGDEALPRLRGAARAPRRGR